ncbi:hypothetical protein NDU88_002805 [Pleurodeles waltl]|uniref:Uncharacterized protein n=1 Tax=Pleurodeles waltl TaxID=8319 RepID=A0AAV7WQJ9_PLEWA|nr:hypothetical protein NDU88_002805 [Pleurodeles waltl]
MYIPAGRSEDLTCPIHMFRRERRCSGKSSLGAAAAEPGLGTALQAALTAALAALLPRLRCQAAPLEIIGVSAATVRPDRQRRLCHPENAFQPRNRSSPQAGQP